MPSLVSLVCVDPARVAQIWPVARQFIRSAIERTDLSEFADIEREVLSGDQLLWLAWSGQIEAAATTHLIKTKDKPVLVITACGGHGHKRWRHLLAKIEDYARKEGAKCVRIYGRKGWERALDNYRVEHVILEKAL